MAKLQKDDVVTAELVVETGPSAAFVVKQSSPAEQVDA